MKRQDETKRLDWLLHPRWTNVISVNKVLVSSCQ